MEGAEGERALPFGLHALPNVGLVTPGYVAAFHLEFDKGKKEDIKPGELHKVRDPPPPAALPSPLAGRDGDGDGGGGRDFSGMRLASGTGGLPIPGGGQRWAALLFTPGNSTRQEVFALPPPPPSFPARPAIWTDGAQSLPATGSFNFRACGSCGQASGGGGKYRCLQDAGC